MNKGLDPQEVANALTGDYKYIAMDKDGQIYAYLGKPKLADCLWTRNYEGLFELIPFSINWGDKPWTECIVEKQVPFEITETGLYRTRDWKMAFIGVIQDDGNYPVKGMLEGRIDETSWTKDGRLEIGEISKYDIVGKWE